VHSAARRQSRRGAPCHNHNHRGPAWLCHLPPASSYSAPGTGSMSGLVLMTPCPRENVYLAPGSYELDTLHGVRAPRNLTSQLASVRVERALHQLGPAPCTWSAVPHGGCNWDCPSPQSAQSAMRLGSLCAGARETIRQHPPFRATLLCFGRARARTFALVCHRAVWKLALCRRPAECTSSWDQEVCSVSAEAVVATIDASCSEGFVVTCASTVLYREVVMELRLCIGQQHLQPAIGYSNMVRAR
jgi:hypothetical protein